MTIYDEMRSRVEEMLNNEGVTFLAVSMGPTEAGQWIIEKIKLQE